MRIGIDFDNTIANYDDVFKKISVEHNLINHLWVGNKKQLKEENKKKNDTNYKVTSLEKDILLLKAKLP